jgi:Transport and Golgi organisation 2
VRGAGRERGDHRRGQHLPAHRHPAGHCAERVAERLVDHAVVVHGREHGLAHPHRVQRLAPARRLGDPGPQGRQPRWRAVHGDDHLGTATALLMRVGSHGDAFFFEVRTGGAAWWQGDPEQPCTNPAGIARTAHAACWNSAMCTAVVSVDPHSPVPVLMLGVRDEYLDRGWLGPGRHWPRRDPALIGGLDLQAGGTWLAVNTAAPRAACVLNGRGRPADPADRLSRGGLPLALASAAGLDGLGGVGAGGLDPARYDPFHLIGATPAAARMCSWDGERLIERELGPGVHIVVNSGLGSVEADGSETDEEGAELMRARTAHFRPLWEQAARPEPRPGATVEEAWGAWLPLAGGGGLDPADPRAILVRRPAGETAWGTSSVSLVAIGRDEVRYDFNPLPGSAAAWTALWPRTGGSAAADGAVA